MKIHIDSREVITLKCKIFGKIVKFNVDGNKIQDYSKLNYAAIDFEKNISDNECEIRYGLYGFVDKPNYDADEQLWGSNEDYEKFGYVTDLDCKYQRENSLCEIEWL